MVIIMYEFIKHFWLFVFGAFIGFVVESIWCLIKHKRLESRKGILYGPFTPVYGFASLFITLILELFKIKNLLLIFLITFVICAFVEYATSYLQEKIFATKSWDYSNFPYNLNGRINLLYILAFSLIGLLWIKIYPIYLKILFGILNKLNMFYEFSLSAIILMIINGLLSIIVSLRQKNRRKGIIPQNKLEVWIDKKYTDEYLKKVYANAVDIKPKL